MVLNGTQKENHDFGGPLQKDTHETVFLITTHSHIPPQFVRLPSRSYQDLARMCMESKTGTSQLICGGKGIDHGKDVRVTVSLWFVFRKHDEVLKFGTHKYWVLNFLFRMALKANIFSNMKGPNVG